MRLQTTVSFDCFLAETRSALRSIYSRRGWSVRLLRKLFSSNKHCLLALLSWLVFAGELSSALESGARMLHIYTRVRCWLSSYRPRLQRWKTWANRSLLIPRSTRTCSSAAALLEKLKPLMSQLKNQPSGMIFPTRQAAEQEPQRKQPWVRKWVCYCWACWQDKLAAQRPQHPSSITYWIPLVWRKAIRWWSCPADPHW